MPVARGQENSGAAHMLREIREQPEVVHRLLDAGREVLTMAARLRRNPGVVILAGRGSSHNAAIYGKYLVEMLLGVPCALAAPSITTLYRATLRLRNAVVIALSQSGESTDILEFVHAARRRGAQTVAVTNVEGSALTAAAHDTLWLRAGPERSVAATKTYVAQLTALAMLVAAWSHATPLVRAISALSSNLERALTLESVLREYAARYRHMEECLVTARGFNYATALETALKLKETCYVVAEALSAADLLHGPIAVVEHGFPVVLFALRGGAADSVRQAVERLHGLGAEILAITDEPAGVPGATLVVSLPLATPEGVPLPEALTPIPAIVPAQFLAYHLAVLRGINPDQPRGLRKVTRTR